MTSLKALARKPEFYDCFGTLAFLFLTIIILWSMRLHMPLPKWANIILLIIGIAGLVVDGTIVYNKFLR